MSATNYESQWWGYIYDQMMEDGLNDWLQDNRRFYQVNLKGVKGPVLECACGTGLVLLPLLQAGHDMYGFDVSIAMLAALKRKASAHRIDVSHRVSVQAMETFRYEQQFEAIIVPTNSFSMLSTQDAQIQALRNMHAHLTPGGKLLLDLRLAGMRDLVDSPEIVEGQWYIWTHPETGRPIRQRIVGRYDFNQQLTLDRCFIEYDGQTEDFLMTGRWIFRDEFQLLLRLAGFRHWEAFSTPERSPLVVGKGESYSYWMVEK